uniref:Uncharacterized protein n=1 Tax=viral metagenome TaxID=1070528 RepID=A0A6C0D0V2_9ZZZZ
MGDNKSQDKHIHYYSKYKSNDLFWGIGIENELYLQFNKHVNVNKKCMLNNHKPERYSVDYYKNFNKDDFKDALNKLIKDNNTKLPLLLNCHSFQKTDANGEPITLYDRENTPNTNFSGKTLHELLCEKDPYFSKNFKKSYIYDGDTIEIVTQNFYKTTIEDVIQELVLLKKEYINRVKKVFKENNIFSQFGEIDFCKQNHGFAVFLTNKNNVAVCNNMTYHFNITLPTQLTADKKIANLSEFVIKHQNAIRLFQWLSPIFIALYNTPDILSKVSDHFSKGSQRCALSRYIGVGTYNSNSMPNGKLLNDDFYKIPYYNLPYWWYHNYYYNSGYVQCEKIGYDINFNKFMNHGIEIRIFEYFPEDKLYEFLTFIVYLLDHSLHTPNICNPVENEEWNITTANIIKNGILHEISFEMLKNYEIIFGINLQRQKYRNIKNLFNKLKKYLEDIYHNSGDCSMKMIKTRNTETVSNNMCTIL